MNSTCIDAEGSAQCAIPPDTHTYRERRGRQHLLNARSSSYDDHVCHSLPSQPLFQILLGCLERSPRLQHNLSWRFLCCHGIGAVTHKLSHFNTDFAGETVSERRHTFTTTQGVSDAPGERQCLVRLFGLYGKPFADLFPIFSVKHHLQQIVCDYTTQLYTWSLRFNILVH